MASKHWVTLALACAASLATHAAPVSISGSLTSFQSALSEVSTFNPSGNGTLNGTPLVIDPNLPTVIYDGGGTTLYQQSQVVALPGGTTSVQFEYTSLIGFPFANPNIVSFAAAATADVNLGDTFKVGTLTYTNGFWFPFATIGLTITTSSTNPQLHNQSFVGNLIVKVSSPEPFAPDPIANADYFYLQSATGPLTSLGSVRVYERDYQPPGNPGNTGSVDLYARIGSLIPTSFQNESGGVFLSASLAPITTAVPEPHGFAMLLAGLGVAGFLARRHKARRSV